MSGVFVAGEVAGIGGAQAAMAEGTLAGLAAARQIGRQVTDRALQVARNRRRRHRSFGRLLNELFEVQPGLYGLMRDEVVVCRCEEVTAGEVRAMLTDWTANVNVVKAITRCGMGPCQGRVCGELVAELTARNSGRPIEAVDSFHVRPPLKPLPIEVLTRVEAEGRSVIS